MLAEMLSAGSGGGSSAEWIDMTLSNGNLTASASWGYDADAILFSLTIDTRNWFVYIETNAPDTMIYGIYDGNTLVSGHTFSQHGMTITVTGKRQISLSYSSAHYFSAPTCILPIVNKVD